MYARLAKITAFVLSGFTLIGVAAATTVACYGMQQEDKVMPLAIVGATCYTRCTRWNMCNDARTWTVNQSNNVAGSVTCEQIRTVIQDFQGNFVCGGAATNGTFPVTVNKCIEGSNPCPPPGGGGGGTGEEDPNPCNGC